MNHTKATQRDKRMTEEHAACISEDWDIFAVSSATAPNMADSSESYSAMEAMAEYCNEVAEGGATDWVVICTGCWDYV